SVTILDKPVPIVIGKRYTILGQLGTGGMGIVYRAQDRLTGQQIALKQVLIPAWQQPAALDQETRNIPQSTGPTSPHSTKHSLDIRLALAQEFQLLASLRHPNIISVLDYGFDGEGSPYFTMELLE